MKNDVVNNWESSSVLGGSDFVPPPAGAVSLSKDDYKTLYNQSLSEPEKFWDAAARELEWYEPWRQILDCSKAPFFRWFVGGKTNVVLNAIDRHASGARRDHVALIWQSEAGYERRFTYAELDREVCEFANVLKSFGLEKGDRVLIYMPRIPEQAIAMFACAKVGLVHSVVYGGLSVDAVHSRTVDSGARLLITADGGYLNNKIIELKKIVDGALHDAPTV